jgi:hypothetical protein
MDAGSRCPDTPRLTSTSPGISNGTSAWRTDFPPITSKINCRVRELRRRKSNLLAHDPADAGKLTHYMLRRENTRNEFGSGSETISATTSLGSLQLITQSAAVTALEAVLLSLPLTRLDEVFEASRAPRGRRSAFRAPLVSLHAQLILPLPRNRQVRELIFNFLSHLFPSGCARQATCFANPAAVSYSDQNPSLPFTAIVQLSSQPAPSRLPEERRDQLQRSPCHWRNHPGARLAA